MKHTQSRKKISFVIPLYNEEDNVKTLVKTLRAYFDNNTSFDFEVVLVENGSHDRTFERLEKYCAHDTRLKVLQLTKNELADGGIAAGLNFINGDACVIMMGDLQEPIEIVTKFIDKWQKGYDIVYGIVKKRTAGTFINMGAKVFYRMMSIATGNAFPEDVADFRLIDKKVYEVIKMIPEKNKYLRGLTIWTGFKHTGVTFDRNPRVAGESKATLSGLMKVVQNGLFSFSYLPLRFITLLGFALTILSFLALILNLILVMINGRQTPGIATIILLMLLLFGILFFILGIISEYIARIYEEVKRRPNFIVKNTLNIPPHG